MKTLLALIVAACFAAGASAQQAKPSKAQEDAKSAVEATVRSFEEAVQDYNREKTKSFLTPDARWIEYSVPVKFDDEWQLVEKLRTSGISIAYQLHDFEVHVQGDMAWVTLTLEGTFTRDAAEGQKPANSQAVGGCFDTAANGPCESRFTYVESEVLVRTPGGWKIALGHTSRLPKAQK